MTINLLGPISLKLDREGYRAAILTSGPCCLLKLRKNGALHVGRSVHNLEYMIFIIFVIKTPLRILIARGGDQWRN